MDTRRSGHSVLVRSDIVHVTDFLLSGEVIWTISGDVDECRHRAGVAYTFRDILIGSVSIVQVVDPQGLRYAHTVKGE